MNAVKDLFGLKAQNQQPSKLDEDDIYPASFFDDTKTFRDMMLLWTFHFNDVLDPDKLHGSLARLLEIGDWRKIGGRQRINAQGKLEFHVPKTFTPERPALKYSHKVFDMKIEDHPLGKKFPKVAGKPSLHIGSHAFKEFAATSDDAVDGSDLLIGDKPQMSLNIVSFNDATLVSLVFCHTLMDAGGLQALLQNWSLVLAGRESEVSPVLVARDDIARAIAKGLVDDEDLGKSTQDEELKIAPKLLSGLQMLIFGIRFLWDLFWYGTAESRSIFLPKTTMDRLRREAMDEITASPSTTEVERPFISEGDVISAWTAKRVAESDSRQLPVSIINAVNLRYRFKSLTQSTGVYVQNLSLCAFTFVSAAAARGPLGPIALANRKHLVDQITQPQIRALLRTLIAETEKGKDVTLFGESNMRLVVISNWTKAELTQAADFSSAVVRQGEGHETRKNSLGQMTQVYPSMPKESIMSKNVMAIKGKDNEGNYWLDGRFATRTWLKFEDEIERLGRYEI
ncbi:Chloramphenicol acetyltransferase-like domain protein [Fusarium austroafricanum]|uniref:Chloramphenicol acetyltransferase-like domain protein n=1 Tax=Fusarium austroafricanum TaxID=2364996 RepID=A0A8H4KX96_9HYPO|nr:Chloramphenicol acetyltransferase-like domain protein [Fusarium austroafricanum]